MKRNKNRTGIYQSALSVAMLLLTLALGSCTDEPLYRTGGTDQEYASFTLELTPPGAFTPATTRAVDVSTISSTVVLVYQDDKLLAYHRKMNEAHNKLEVTLKTSQSESDLYDIMVIGNPPAEGGFEFNNYIGQSKKDLKRDLTASTSGKWSGTIMMWGEVTKVLVHPQTNTFNIEMLRSLARIDVGLGTYNGTGWTGLGSTFSLTEVRVVNTRNMFAIIPDTVDYNRKVIGPTVPTNAGAVPEIIYSGTEISQDAAGRGNHTQSAIFIPEAKNTLPERVVLLIGGKYNNSTDATYYRIDMCVPNDATPGGYDYLPILRNHLYRVNITKISGPGFSTAAEALKYAPINITTELKPLDEGGGSGDIIFDGNSYIMTDVSEIQIYGKPGRYEKILTVKVGYAEGEPASITGPGLSASLERDTLTTYDVTLPEGTGMTESYTITVGKLKKIIPLRMQAPVDAHFDMLPFKNVAHITIDAPQSWITLSPNKLWKKNEQQLVSIDGNTEKKAYVHFDENIAQTSTTRKAKALIVRSNFESNTTRVFFEQINIKDMICENFGGDFIKNNLVTDTSVVYAKHLAVESLEEFAFRIYDGEPYRLPVDPPSIPTQEITAPVNGIYMGKFTPDLGTDLGTGFDEKGAETTYKHVTNRTETQVSRSNLTIYNNYASRYCFDKNRDNNDNGQIDQNEVVWYVPTRLQMVGIYLLRNTLKSSMVTNGDAPSYWDICIKGNKISIMDLSNGMASEHDGVARIRCVRDISK